MAMTTCVRLTTTTPGRGGTKTFRPSGVRDKRPDIFIQRLTGSQKSLTMHIW